MRRAASSAPQKCLPVACQLTTGRHSNRRFPDCFPSYKLPVHLSSKQAGISPKRRQYVWRCTLAEREPRSPPSEAQRGLSESLDVVILSNGPGEVAAWVKPVVRALRKLFGEDRKLLRISVVLAPCPHASLQEQALVQTFPEVDRCQGPEHFTKLLLWGKTSEHWDWHKKGVCIFLGGDQFNALLLGWRLGYQTLLYAEDAVRWAWLAGSYALRTATLLDSVPRSARQRCKVVGDLFQDAVKDEKLQEEASKSTEGQLVGLLPGSKGVKLQLGVPFMMAVAEHLDQRLPGVKFVVPLAPTVDLPSLQKYASSASNGFIQQLHWGEGALQEEEGPSTSGRGDGPSAKLVTKGGVAIDVVREFPAYRIFQECDICVTTMGTNTAELGSLGVPMVVILPTHALEVFRGGTGGLGGLLANLPGVVGVLAARAVNETLLKTAGFIAWPNRWAGREVVPEMVGKIEPSAVAMRVEDLLKNPIELEHMKEELLALRTGPSHEGFDSHQGPAAAIAEEVRRLVS